MKLSPKQERFCEEYLIDLNGTQAAIRAGYSPRTANEQAARLLAKVSVQEYVRNLREKMANKLEATRERVLQEYARIAFTDIRDFYDENGNLKEVINLNDDAAAALSGIEIEEIIIAGKSVGTLRKVKRWDKKGALDSICKMMGYNAPDKTELTGKDGRPLFPKPDFSKLTKEELKQFVELSKKIRPGE